MINKSNYEITLREGGCGCCADYSMLLIDENKQPISLTEENEYLYYYKQIQLSDVKKYKDYLTRQIELANELEKMLASVQNLNT